MSPEHPQLFRSISEDGNRAPGTSSPVQSSPRALLTLPSASDSTHSLTRPRSSAHPPQKPSHTPSRRTSQTRSCLLRTGQNRQTGLMDLPAEVLRQIVGEVDIPTANCVALACEWASEVVRGLVSVMATSPSLLQTKHRQPSVSSVHIFSAIEGCPPVFLGRKIEMDWPCSADKTPKAPVSSADSLTSLGVTPQPLARCDLSQTLTGSFGKGLQTASVVGGNDQVCDRNNPC